MSSFGRRFLVGALLLCGLLFALYLAAARNFRGPTTEVAASITGVFPRDGEFRGQPSHVPLPLRRWGSWSGRDDHVGRLTLGPFPAPAVLQFEISGYPRAPGNALFVQLAATGETVPLQPENPGERWQTSYHPLPDAWRGQPVSLVAVDEAQGWGGWLALSEPFQGGPTDPHARFLETLTAWSLNGLLLGLLVLAAARLLAPFAASRPALRPWLPLLASAAVALAAYALFWLFFADRFLGRAGVVLLFAAAATCVWRRDTSSPIPELQRELTAVGIAAIVIGAFSLGITYLSPSTRDLYWTAANRFAQLPADNIFPHLIAERLYLGGNLKERLADWLVSDRPPLQTAWQLLTRSAFSLLPLDPLAATGTAAVWLQLTWVAAAHGLLRTFGLSLRRTAAWLATFALSGFFLVHTVFTWPKLCAAAFACGAFGLWVLAPPPARSRLTIVMGAVLAALAWLCHGGVAFSFLALAPWVLWRCLRGDTRSWLTAAVAFGLLAAPWIAYQKIYDPPANRLLKWHLAGQVEIDPRGTLEAIRENYAALPPGTAWETRLNNFALQARGAFQSLVSFDAASAHARRLQEFTFTSRALAAWLIALPLLPFALWRLRRDPARPAVARPLLALIAWAAGTLVVWCLLMFQPGSAIVHQGSFAAMLAAFVALSLVVEHTHRGGVLLLAALQASILIFTWAAPSPNIPGSVPAWPLALTAVSGIALLALLVRAFRADSPSPFIPTSPLPSPVASFFDCLKAWWLAPRVTIWLLLAIGTLLYLRKPHALHTAQLWAEDGSIFLAFADLDGAAALVTPYMGYLHTLPRLIAGVAPLLFDPAWWPTFYNVLSFAIWVGVIAYVFSPRLALPGKPWLALAFTLGPNTGEILFNITNLQWIIAFLLVLQALIAPPTHWRQRVLDLTLVALASLTGPFVIAFAPLFLWRWWRDRRPDNLVLLAVVVLCAAVQAGFILQTGPRFDYQGKTLSLLPLCATVARRLFVWPALGKHAALGLPPLVVAALGLLVVGGLLLWALRPHPRRDLRARVILAFLCILFVGVWRTRPDTWGGDNLYFSDRYFYIPRVLLAWLLIWEFDAASRALAWFARLACLATSVLHLHEYRVPAPIDYKWAEHVEPIRRGIPANIPILPENWTLEYRGRRP